MTHELQQALLYASAFVILSGTLVVFVVQLVRMRRRDRDGGDDTGGGGA